MNFLTVSGEAATRVSAAAVSTGMKSLGKIKTPPTQARLRGRRFAYRSFPEDCVAMLTRWLCKKNLRSKFMGLKAIECPDGVCHSHHGGHAVEQQAMREVLKEHGREWCERLAERIYEMSVDTFTQTVMPSLHAAGWQRRHLDWEFKLAEDNSEPDRTLVDGIINATESFLRSSEVHQLFIQELVQGTFEEASEEHLQRQAVKHLIKAELLSLLAEQREDLLDRCAAQLLDSANGNFDQALDASIEGLQEVEQLLTNHHDAL
jgi:hypothetical protein